MTYLQDLVSAIPTQAKEAFLNACCGNDGGINRVWRAIGERMLRR